MTTAADRHPPGLFLLFFVEMWERFSFYGMRALLVFYLTKGFLKASDDTAYGIYGAYGALVYATPYLGGMLADRLLGSRLAVIWGGLLMAAGHLLMTIEQQWALFGALALLICGNGFFKPNISTMVGAMYPAASQRRDAGFTIFYMGINLGAALAPLVCGYIGETFGWHYGFGLATVGMLTGLATFVAPPGLARGLIAFASVALVAIMVIGSKDDALQLAVSAPIGVALLVAGLVSVVRLGQGSIPHDVGRPRDVNLMRSRLVLVLAGTLLAVPVLALLVLYHAYAGWALNIAGLLAFGSIILWTFRSPRVERDRLIVILVLCFFSMLFWAFFEQAGSSVNNFTDRNIDRVVGDEPVEAGRTYENVIITQEFLGHTVNGREWSLTHIEEAIRVRALENVPGAPTDGSAARSEAETAAAGGASPGHITFTATAEHVERGLAVHGSELRASIFQAANPTFILLFGLPFSILWSWLGARGRDPSAPTKFALGLFQLALGFGAFWYGAKVSDGNGMVAMSWLLIGYLLQTTGELCLSPVGLSLVTRLSPARVVSTIMGAWFLATAFSHLLAAAIAKLTGVSEGGEGAAIPPPLETVHVYGDVFGGIGLGALAAGILMLLLSPLLRRMMHVESLGAENPSQH